MAKLDECTKDFEQESLSSVAGSLMQNCSTFFEAARKTNQGMYTSQKTYENHSNYKEVEAKSGIVKHASGAIEPPKKTRH